LVDVTYLSTFNNGRLTVYKNPFVESIIMLGMRYV